MHSLISETYQVQKIPGTIAPSRAAAPCFPFSLLPSQSPWAQGPIYKQIHELRVHASWTHERHTFLSPSWGCCILFHTSFIHWAHLFCIVISCADLTSPSKSWRDLILPLKPHAPSPFFALASPFHLCSCVWACLQLQWCFCWCLPPPNWIFEWQSLSLLDFYTSIKTLYILAVHWVLPK